MSKYGITYQGSKNEVADYIINFLPAGQRFVDLFGGGFAMSHCALLSGKYFGVFYNEINPLLVELIGNAIAGKVNTYKGKFIDRETFKQLKDQDGFIKYLWSFGCAGIQYMYSKELEPWKKAVHHARVLGDMSQLEKFGIKSNGSIADIREHEEEYKQKYIDWYCKTIMRVGDIEPAELKKDLKNKIANQKEELRLYLVDALHKSGLRACDINREIGTNMAVHYFGKSQWQFPTEDAYNKMRGIMPLKPYYEVYGYFELLPRLQNLQRLENLQRLQKQITINCGNYLDYNYRRGDVVYCDIPYEGVFGYDEEFNHKEFYDWANSRPFPVWFSSYNNISDKRFIKVWEKKKQKKLGGACSDKVTECLYINEAGSKIKTTFLD